MPADSPKNPELIFENSHNPKFYASFKKSIRDDINFKITKLSSSSLLINTCQWIISQAELSLKSTVLNDKNVLELTKSHHSISLNFNSEEYIAILKNIHCWTFESSSLNKSDLIKVSIVILIESTKQASVSFTLYQIAVFVLLLYLGYPNNPYHSFNHSVDTTQSTFYILNKMGVFNAPSISSEFVDSNLPQSSSKVLKPIDGLKLILSSFGHDLRHPGLTNKILRISYSHLSTIYNRKSSLEHYHADYLFSILDSIAFLHSPLKKLPNSPEIIYSHPQSTTNTNSDLMDILVLKSRGRINDADSCVCGNCENDTSTSLCSQNILDTSILVCNKFRRLILISIMATDMEKHFDYICGCVNFNSMHDNIPKSSKCSIEEEDIYCYSIMKCSDISNISRPFQSAQSWAVCLYKEIQLQSEYEATNKINKTTSPLDVPGIPSFQIFFYEKIALPLFLAVRDIIPSIDFMIKGIYENLEVWKKLDALSNDIKIPQTYFEPQPSSDTQVYFSNTIYKPAVISKHHSDSYLDRKQEYLTYFGLRNKNDLSLLELQYLDYIYRHIVLNLKSNQSSIFSQNPNFSFFSNEEKAANENVGCFLNRINEDTIVLEYDSGIEKNLFFPPTI
ncbi:cGMP-specific 3',5'-cGMP phosphodiesterase 3 [Smittium culicis]|uniref:Phosphodiesterase n=1 Tax=Smittium culicis TaxID=133412 RepID=A0A1R1YHV8_9FUNG|nr:cGMP-specific 3',5'-cGMP phosphodiesterase 3 [Smittium culicis]